MGWLSRIWRTPSRDVRPERQKEAVPPPVVRTAPGVAAIFAGLKNDGSHGILDLGPAVEANLRFYGRFARWVRFGSLLRSPPRGDAWQEALQELPPLPDRPYDVVMAWNILDRLPPEHRPLLIERIAQLTGPGARLYVLVDGSGEDLTYPLRFSIQDDGFVSQEKVGPASPAYPQLLPAEVERILTPFHVAHAFTLRGGFREYVARWSEQEAGLDTWWTR
ncbi:MAG: class I SAM-dependent methyltransferase [Longimicrobiales bacterium]